MAKRIPPNNVAIVPQSQQSLKGNMGPTSNQPEPKWESGHDTHAGEHRFCLELNQAAMLPVPRR